MVWISSNGRIVVGKSRFILAKISLRYTPVVVGIDEIRV